MILPIWTKRYLIERYGAACELVVVDGFDVQSVILKEVVELVVDKDGPCHFLGDLKCDVARAGDALLVVVDNHLDNAVRDESHRDAEAEEDNRHDKEGDDCFGEGGDGEVGIHRLLQKGVVAFLFLFLSIVDYCTR